MARKARATSEPSCCVTAAIVPNAAVVSFTSTPKLAAVDPTIDIPSASLVMLTAFKLVILFEPSKTSVNF